MAHRNRTRNFKSGGQGFESLLGTPSTAGKTYTALLLVLSLIEVGEAYLFAYAHGPNPITMRDYRVP